MPMYYTLQNAFTLFKFTQLFQLIRSFLFSFHTISNSFSFQLLSNTVNTIIMKIEALL